MTKYHKPMLSNAEKQLIDAAFAGRTPTKQQIALALEQARALGEL